MNEEYRIIPGYDKYAVSPMGTVKSLIRDKILSSYKLNGYYIVNAFRDSLTETLPVHRAVALAWVDNPDPSRFYLVNHIDGNPTNNHYTNLEWTDHSGNNYHAVANGLRNDNISCFVRDFTTREIFDFPSLAQAAEYMGLSKDAPYEMLRPKMFGKLVKDRFELRYRGDPTPWFYETRNELVPPSRYMVTVLKPDHTSEEIYSTKVLLKTYQLYQCPKRSIPDLVEYARRLYPEYVFIVRDSYYEDQYREVRNTNGSVRMEILACYRGMHAQTFTSLTKCADYFKVDRSTIQSRVDKPIELHGWTFRSKLPDQSEKVD